MAKFDLSALTEADKQELIIRMLTDFNAVIQIWYDRERKRLLSEAGTTDQVKEVQDDLLKEYIEARARITEAYGLKELPDS